MKKHNKVLLAVLCVVLLVVGSVAGTLAYFTDQEAVVNTFTVGNVDIELSEEGMEERDDGTFGKDYHLLPGHSYDKKPVVTVVKGSEESYVRMIVTVSDYDDLEAAFPEETNPTWYMNGQFLLEKLVKGWSGAQWKCVSMDNGVYEFRYFETVDGTDGELAPLFTDVVIPGEIDNGHLAKLQDMEIEIVAHAIQAAGFANEAKAWEAFDIQNP